MPSLQRHDLVWPSLHGWDRLLRGAPDEAARACVQQWFAARLPLVVTRQPPGARELAVGLPAPLAHGRRRIALRLPHDAILCVDAFPRARDVAPQLRGRLRAAWLSLCAQLPAGTRVHGSHGWQQLTGLRYTVAASDIDLLLPVRDADEADAVAALLAAFSWHGPRLDGELQLPGGRGVAWREWQAWRSGGADRVLVKTLRDVGLQGADLLLAGNEVIA